ncbi:hypothetical protein ACFX15_029310 [Malus domestica]
MFWVQESPQALQAATNHCRVKFQLTLSGVIWRLQSGWKEISLDAAKQISLGCSEANKQKAKKILSHYPSNYKAVWSDSSVRSCTAVA